MKRQELEASQIQTLQSIQDGTQKQRLTIPEAFYLKHSGKLIDVKVTIKIVDGEPVIYMRDFEFYSFKPALLFLQHITEKEICSTSSLEEAQS